MALRNNFYTRISALEINHVTNVTTVFDQNTASRGGSRYKPTNEDDMESQQNNSICTKISCTRA